MPNCDGCSKPLAGSAVGIGSKTYHPECFVCAACKQPLQGQFFDKGNGPTCASCAAEPCFSCGKPALSSIQAGGRTYHQECFRCSRCKKELGSGKFARMGDRICCSQCRDAVEDEVHAENLAKRQAALAQSNRLSGSGSTTQLVDRSSGDWARQKATLTPAHPSTSSLQREAQVGSSPLARNSSRHGFLQDMHREESVKAGLGVPGRGSSAGLGPSIAGRGSTAGTPAAAGVEGAAASLSNEADSELVKSLRSLSEIAVAVARSAGTTLSDNASSGSAVRMAASSLSDSITSSADACDVVKKARSIEPHEAVGAISRLVICLRPTKDGVNLLPPSALHEKVVAAVLAACEIGPAAQSVIGKGAGAPFHTLFHAVDHAVQLLRDLELPLRRAAESGDCGAAKAPMDEAALARRASALLESDQQRLDREEAELARRTAERSALEARAKQEREAAEAAERAEQAERERRIAERDAKEEAERRRGREASDTAVDDTVIKPSEIFSGSTMRGPISPRPSSITPLSGLPPATQSQSATPLLASPRGTTLDAGWRAVDALLKGSLGTMDTTKAGSLGLANTSRLVDAVRELTKSVTVQMRAIAQFETVENADEREEQILEVMKAARALVASDVPKVALLAADAGGDCVDCARLVVDAMLALFDYVRRSTGGSLTPEEQDEGAATLLADLRTTLKALGGAAAELTG